MNWAAQATPVRAAGFGVGDVFTDRYPGRDVHNYYSAVVEYPNGAVVNILHSWVATNPYNGEFSRMFGTKGAIDFNAGAFSYRSELEKPNRRGYKYDGIIDNNLMALESFIDSVRTRKPPVGNVDHGRAAALACLLVREAVYTKRVVTMDELIGKVS